jgi:hypothetical protein
MVPVGAVICFLSNANKYLYLCVRMGVRATLIKPYAAYVVSRQNRWKYRPLESQESVFRQLIRRAATTKFGKDHGFADIASYDDFRRQVPVRDYEGIAPYIQDVMHGEKDVLWPGKPLYFAKTSGTTSGTKYIPLTHDSMPNHINSARDALMHYVHESGNASVFDGKMMFLSGSPVLDKSGGVYTGRLSGIVNHHVPWFYKLNQLPSYDTNCIEDWEEKVERIIDETLGMDMRLISGIPPWVQMYFDRIVARTGKKIGEVFPDFSLFVYGGVNFEPYRARLHDTIGEAVDGLETYPASEGFIAYQDAREAEGMLMVLNSGIFYEFIEAASFHMQDPPRIALEDVELNVNYALVLSNNAGLWGYSIGDTIKFVSKNPYRVIVTGRVSHFISAFGEHVIGEEVEKALRNSIQQFPETHVVEFTVAPNVTPSEGLPLHEWYVEFSRQPDDMEAFEKAVDQHLQQLNSYYMDLVAGKILRPLKVIPLSADAFRHYMKSQGKLGGQNKVPRLSNDRSIAEQLLRFRL